MKKRGARVRERRKTRKGVRIVNGKCVKAKKAGEKMKRHKKEEKNPFLFVT